MSHRCVQKLRTMVVDLRRMGFVVDDVVWVAVVKIV